MAQTNNQVQKAPQASDLSLIQAELKAPKSKFNKFGNFYYRSTEDIVEALKPLLVKYGCQLTISDDYIEVASIPSIKATVIFTDSNGVTVTSTAFAGIEPKKGMDMAQVFGSVSTYARKYALNGMFLIDDTKDADSDEYRQDQQSGQQQQSHNQQRQNNQQQSRGQQQQRPMRDVTPKAPQVEQKSQPTQKRFHNALNMIAVTEDPAFLDQCLNAYMGTQYEQPIINACEARADQRGWVKGN